MSAPRIHLPDRLDDGQDPRKPPQRRRDRRGTFVLRLRIHGVRDEHCWRLAQACEDLLRERAPAGVEIRAVELYGSRWGNVKPGKGFRNRSKPA